MTIDEMKEMGARRVQLELQPSLRSLGVGEDAYVVIDNVPADAQLSAGYGNADRSWLVPASELSQVDIVAPNGDGEPVVLNVRVVSLDPNGDSFASTIARFDIHIAPDGAISTAQPSASAPNALRPRSKFPALPGRPTVVERARQPLSAARRFRGRAAAGRARGQPCPDKGARRRPLLPRHGQVAGAGTAALGLSRGRAGAPAAPGAGRHGGPPACRRGRPRG